MKDSKNHVGSVGRASHAVAFSRGFYRKYASAATEATEEIIKDYQVRFTHPASRVTEKGHFLFTFLSARFYNEAVNAEPRPLEDADELSLES